ncbi:hypothetical protein B0H13DRAFT_2497484 [Mycena leptocephala]|nr:hypothetical protein B0H13DRAFT_2497484 [Mycena leptocephala]
MSHGVSSFPPGPNKRKSSDNLVLEDGMRKRRFQSFGTERTGPSVTLETRPEKEFTRGEEELARDKVTVASRRNLYKDVTQSQDARAHPTHVVTPKTVTSTQLLHGLENLKESANQGIVDELLRQGAAGFGEAAKSHLRTRVQMALDHLLTGLLEFATTEQGSQSVVKALKEGGKETLVQHMCGPAEGARRAMILDLALSLMGRQLIASFYLIFTTFLL